MGESPLVYARALTVAELRDEVTGKERRWLNHHPLLWMRALVCLQRETESHIAESRARLRATSPPPGEDDRIARKLTFLRKVKRRKAEVVVLCGPEGATPIVGDILHTLAKIDDLLRTADVTGAIRLVDHALATFSAVHRPVGGKSASP